MGFNMSGSEIGRGKCLQPKGVWPGGGRDGRMGVWVGGWAGGRAGGRAGGGRRAGGRKGGRSGGRTDGWMDGWMKLINN